MKRGAFALGSTAMSGAGNLVAQLLVAVLTTAREFGLFSLASATIIFVLGATRSIIGSTDMVRGSATSDRGAISAAYFLSLAAAAAGVLVIVVAGFAGSTEALLIGIALAGSSVFILQDAQRFRAFRELRPHVAFVSDALALLLSLAGFVAVGLSQLPIEFMLLAWIGATAAGAAYSTASLRHFPRGTPSPGWLLAHRDLVFPTSAEFLLQAGLPYALNWLVAALSGLDSLAGYRLGQLLFAFLANIAQGLDATFLPRISDTRDRSLARNLLRTQFLAVSVLAVTAVVALLLVPAPVGAAIFGGSWVEMLVYFWPVALHGWANAAAVPVYSGLRVFGLAAFSLRVRLWTTVISIVGVLAAIPVFGVVGLAWVMAITAVAALAWRSARIRRELGR